MRSNKKTSFPSSYLRDGKLYRVKPKCLPPLYKIYKQDEALWHRGYSEYAIEYTGKFWEVNRQESVILMFTGEIFEDNEPSSLENMKTKSYYYAFLVGDKKFYLSQNHLTALTPVKHV